MNLTARILPLLFTAALLSGCSGPAKVRPKEPVLATTTAAPALQQAAALEKRQPLEALGHYLLAAREAQARYAVKPQDTAARDTASFALSRAFGVMESARLHTWTGPLQVPVPGGSLTLTARPDPRPAWKASLFEFTPADRYAVKGSSVSVHAARQGVGAPLVASVPEGKAPVNNPLASDRIYYGVTAVARFTGSQCEIAFEDPLAAETTRVNGRTLPLAADFTTPLAFMLQDDNSRQMSIGRLLKPEKFAGTAQITRLQAYDPDKTIVLCIHGLASEPSTWITMINQLRGDAEIRKRYQFWFYSYPSGWPYPHSAAVLRAEMDKVQQTLRPRKPMVVIGHSMGGCISRLLLTDTQGDTLWRKIFPKGPQEMRMSAESHKLLTDALIFKPREEVGRVIFICAPLRGSELANKGFARWGARLIKAPTSLLAAGNEVMKSVTFGAADLKLKQIPNSVDTLSPSNRFVKAINTFPLSTRTPYHVISGDRGKGGNKDHTKPVMSDGLVPYWSSHLPGAVSEKVVPTHHSAQQHSETIAEVARILKAHPSR